MLEVCMKAGILTFHRAINFGAILQGYALQRTVNEFMPCEIIDYKNDMDVHGLSKRVTGFSGKCRLRAKKTLARLLYGQRRRKFAAFLQKQNLLSENAYESAEAMAGSQREYALFIVGSDQVWNADLTYGDKVYFLTGVADGGKKCSYAASFGSRQALERLDGEMISSLHTFSGLSVRENDAADTLSGLLGRSVNTHIDPVFLLSRDAWRSVAVMPPEKDYILLFMMRKSDALIALARQIQRQTGLEIVCIPMGYKRIRGIQYKNDTGPEEFVGLVNNAKYVLTNSFHGTAFSILLHKQLIVEYHQGGSNANSRFQNVLNLFALEHRVLTAGYTPDYREPIDFDAVEEKLENERSRARAYLNDMCDKAAARTNI